MQYTPNLDRFAAGVGGNDESDTPLFVPDPDALRIAIQTRGEVLVTTELTSEEETYLRELLNSRGRGIPAPTITAGILLLSGGLLIAGPALS